MPGTGRSQLTFALSPAQEIQLGEEAYREQLQGAKLVRSGPQYEMLMRIGPRIAQAAEHLYPDSLATEFEWEFSLIDDPKTVNAWCLPGGKVAVYTGLLPVTRDEASLAVVVGHEVAHAIARHGAERISQQTGLQGLLFAGGQLIGLSDMSASTQELTLQALGLGAQVGVLLPFSRTHESEADELGLYMSADAGYEPRAAIGLWERMAAASGGSGPPEFLSTHPSEGTRIQRLEEHMPKALRYYNKARREGRAVE